MMADPLPPSITRHFLIPRADQREALREAYQCEARTGIGHVDQEKYTELLRERFPDEMRVMDLWNEVSKAELWTISLTLLARMSGMGAAHLDKESLTMAIKKLQGHVDILKSTENEQ